MSKPQEMPDVPDAIAHDEDLRLHWPQAVSDICAVIEEAHARKGVDQQTARKLAFVAVRALCWYEGGRFVYLPKGERLDAALRERMIWHAHLDGASIPELAERFGRPEAKIREIVIKQGSLHAARAAEREARRRIASANMSETSRNASMRDAYTAGVEPGMLARRYDLSEVQVRQILNEGRVPSEPDDAEHTPVNGSLF